MGSIIGAVTDPLLGTDLQGKKAAEAALNAQRGSAAEAGRIGKETLAGQTAEYDPYKQAGLAALGLLSGRVANTPEQLQKRKDLQAQLEEAQKQAQKYQGVKGPFGIVTGQDKAMLEATNKNISDLQNQIGGISDYRQLSPQETAQNLMGSDPGYQFRLEQGNRALNAAAAARGRSVSGAALKELSRYGQDYATGEYGNAFNRQMGLANMGYNAATGISNAMGGYGQGQQQSAIGLGNAEASSRIAQSNRLNQDIGQAIQLGTAVMTGGASLPFTGGLGGGGGMSAQVMPQQQYSLNSGAQINPFRYGG